MKKKQEWYIDQFFNSLELNRDDDPVVEQVKLGELMSVVDAKNRWVYQGSFTSPPCTTGVYWNIVRSVLPLKTKHLEYFKKQLDRAGSNMRVIGSYRDTQ